MPPVGLELLEGLSSEISLPCNVQVVVHEILGHIASSEGVSQQDLYPTRRRCQNPEPPSTEGSRDRESEFDPHP